MKAITLKSRITILLTIFTIVIIAIFITIQLLHEMKSADKLLSYKTAKDSKSIKEGFDKVSLELLSEKLTSLDKALYLLKEMPGLDLPPQEKIEALAEGIKLLDSELSKSLPSDSVIERLGQRLLSLKERETFEIAYLLDREAKIVFATEEGLIGSSGDKDDLRVIKRLNSSQSLKGSTVINRPLKLFSRYLPLGTNQEVLFLVRVFFPLTDIWRTLEGVYSPAITIGILLIIVNIILGIFLGRLVIKPIGIFNNAAKKIAGGKLDLRVELSTNDELEELADTFNYMTEELVRMKQRAENANPLTKLPGNIVIMEEVEKKIKEAKKFLVIYCDLDNFKAFNDKYGIHKGDEAIILTGEIFKEAVKAKGNPDDFVGHEGGDDFLLLTTPDKARAIADHIMEELDKRSKALYDKEDVDRGYIVAHSRDGAVKKFPLLSISLAGVSNEYREIKTYAEVTNIAATLKKKAKKETNSCYVVDERQ